MSYDKSGKNNPAYKHGKRHTSIYRLWQAIRERCYNEKCKDFPNYGGRGITMSDAWRSFENFYRDMGERPPGKTLDRMDNSKGYSKENCRWATNIQQHRNTRANVYIEYEGATRTLKEWSEIFGIPYKTLRYRIRVAKWPFEIAIKEPVTRCRPKNSFLVRPEQARQQGC